MASLIAEQGLEEVEASVAEAVGSVAVAPRPYSPGSVAGTCRLSGTKALGIFPEQGLNLCLLHQQADSLPLSHQGSPSIRDFSFHFLQPGIGAG